LGIKVQVSLEAVLAEAHRLVFIDVNLEGILRPEVRGSAEQDQP